MNGPAVIKIGGELVAPDGLPALWAGISRVAAETPVILVHGGGGRATQLAERLGHSPRIVQGRRVTSDLDLDIVLWTMRGEVNARLVAAGTVAGLKPVGISGSDGGVLQVQKRPPWTIDGESIDFGWVGDVLDVDTTLLSTLLEAGYCPVVAPVGIDGAGKLYNVNADTVAGAIARRIQAHRLLLVTEAGGLRTASDGTGTALSECDSARFEAGLDEGWIRGGMRVKMQIALQAAQTGVRDVRIVGPADLGTAGGTRVLANAS